MDLSKLLNCTPPAHLHAPAPASPTTSCSSLSISTLLNPSHERQRDRANDHVLPLRKRPRLGCSVITSPISVRRWPSENDFVPVSSSSSYSSDGMGRTMHFTPIIPVAGLLNAKSAELLPYSAARKLAQSRIVGLRHRQNEKLRKQSLEFDLQRLSDENDMLAAQIRIAKRTRKESIRDTSPTIELNSESRNIIGSAEITGETALLLLELIALRRNLVVQQPFDLNATIECPNEVDIEGAVKIRRKKWNEENIEIHAKWADFEANCMMTEEKEKAHKRCTRCGKFRSAGSGHPRSSCDDGFRVASMIPYSEEDVFLNKR